VLRIATYAWLLRIYRRLCPSLLRVAAICTKVCARRSACIIYGNSATCLGLRKVLGGLLSFTPARDPERVAKTLPLNNRIA